MRPGLILIFLGGVLLPSLSTAMGLGEIRLESALNQPLRAEIDLHGATADELSSLKMGLASEERYRRAGVPRSTALLNIEFSLRRHGKRTFVRITSKERIAEPLLILLVDAQWADGRLSREYSVFLDPPLLPEQNVLVASPPPAISTAASTRGSRASRYPIASGATSPTAGAPQIGAQGLPRSYGPVRRGETLSTIAQKLISGTSYRRNVMALALYEANIDQFAGNVNSLKAGATLRVPDQAALAAISPQQAATRLRALDTSLSNRGSAIARGQVTTGNAQASNQSTTAAARSGSNAAQQDRLVLVPSDPQAASNRPGAANGSQGRSDVASADGAAGSGVFGERIRDLESNVEELQSLLAVRSDEIARLEQMLRNQRLENAGSSAANNNSSSRPVRMIDGFEGSGSDTSGNDFTGNEFGNDQWGGNSQAGNAGNGSVAADNNDSTGNPAVQGSTASDQTAAATADDGEELSWAEQAAQRAQQGRGGGTVAPGDLPEFDPDQPWVGAYDPFAEIDGEAQPWGNYDNVPSDVMLGAVDPATIENEGFFGGMLSSVTSGAAGMMALTIFGIPALILIILLIAAVLLLLAAWIFVRRKTSYIRAEPMEAEEAVSSTASWQEFNVAHDETAGNGLDDAMPAVSAKVVSIDTDAPDSPDDSKVAGFDSVQAVGVSSEAEDQEEPEDDAEDALHGLNLLQGSQAAIPSIRRAPYQPDALGNISSDLDDEEEWLPGESSVLDKSGDDESFSDQDSFADADDFAGDFGSASENLDLSNDEFDNDGQLADDTADVGAKNELVAAEESEDLGLDFDFESFMNETEAGNEVSASDVEESGSLDNNPLDQAMEFDTESLNETAETTAEDMSGLSLSTDDFSSDESSDDSGNNLSVADDDGFDLSSFTSNDSSNSDSSADEPLFIDDKLAEQEAEKDHEVGKPAEVDDFNAAFDDDFGDSSTVAIGDVADAEDETGMSTRIDLAQAFLEMGDTDEARQMLEDVVAHGSETEQQRAKQLLSEI